MEAGEMAPEDRYQDLVDALAGAPGMAPPPGGTGMIRITRS
jgi:hypothetical protein